MENEIANLDNLTELKVMAKLPIHYSYYTHATILR